MLVTVTIFLNLYPRVLVSSTDPAGTYADTTAGNGVPVKLPALTY